MLSVNNINYYRYNYTNNLNRVSFKSSPDSLSELSNLLAESHRIYTNVYKRPGSIVHFPVMSQNSIVIEDLLPIGKLHLLLFYKDRAINSLSEKFNDLNFINDFEQIFRTLKFLYPEQNIIFFEHGSGKISIKPNNETIHLGKSVKIAHGHFCVMPQNQTTCFDELVESTPDIWSYMSLYETPQKPIIIDGTVPNLIDKQKFYSKDYPPYLLLSEYDAKTNKTRTALFLQQNPNIKIPSQLYRMKLSQIVYKENNPLYWNWKQFLTELRGNKSPFVLKRVDDIQNNSIEFERKLNTLSNPTYLSTSRYI